MSRCVLECGRRDSHIIQCIGLCGAEIHPACAGISNNWLRLNEPDEFLVFKCQKCRDENWRDVSSAMKQMGEFQSSCMDILQTIAKRMKEMDTQFCTVVDHIDDMSKSICDLEANILQGTKKASMQSTLSTLKLHVADLVAQQSTIDSTLADLQCSTASNQDKLTAKVERIIENQKISIIDHIDSFLECRFNTMQDSSKCDPGSKTGYMEQLPRHLSDVISEKLNESVSDSPSNIFHSINPTLPLHTDPSKTRKLPENRKDVQNKKKWGFLHVSYMPTDTTVDMLKSFVQETFNVRDVICNKLWKNSCSPNQLKYLSFKVCVTESLIEDLLHSDLWPIGVKVRVFVPNWIHTPPAVIC